MKTKTILLFMIACMFVLKGTYAQNEVIPFDSDRWNRQTAKEAELLGRKCLMGIASLKDVEFTNGVIEFDLAVNGERSYPGITFRAKDKDNYERIYIRPHLSKVFQSVVQYEGTFNGLDSWQLYYGPGKTTSATFPVNEWFHVKIEVKDTQAKFYIVDMANPVLTIPELAHGISKGSLGVWGPMDGSAYFSNFSYRADDNLQFANPPLADDPFGIISNWEISQAMRLNAVDMESYPGAEEMKNLKWQKVQSLPSGLVDISRYFGRLSQVPDVIWAKTELISDKAQRKQFTFGYSDVISIYLNGVLLFMGNSEYTSRDFNFQGIVGCYDNIILPLNKGKNELMIAVAESFGGWGFMFRDVDAIYQVPQMAKQWEIKNKFKYPESVVYDRKRDVLYVSNLTYEQDGFISKVKMNGEIEKIDWITGILQPTGVTIFNDKLYIVGRYNLVEYDLEKNSISNRYAFPAPVFANDVTCDESGIFYVSDGNKGSVYKLENGKFIEWIKSGELRGVNGILAKNKQLYAGTSGDGSIKAIDTDTKKIATLFTFGKSTVMDGLAMDEKGNLLFSDNAGRLFRLTADGKNELLLNTKSRQINLADFEYIAEKKMLIIPTFVDNKLMGYKINKK